MPDWRYPTRHAKCPDCGKTLTAYVPTVHIESIHGPRAYRFRSHERRSRVHGELAECPGWGKRVPDDAFLDGRPNLDPITGEMPRERLT